MYRFDLFSHSPFVCILTGHRYYVGSGVLSVMGVSFAILTVASKSFSQMYANGYCPVAEDGTKLPCPDAYGALLGTSACCAIVEVLLAFIPPKTIKKIFPPIVTGPTVMLIGISLISTGFEDWAGGSGCTSGICPSEGAPHAAPWGSPEFIGLGFLVFVSILICERFGAPIMKSCSVVIGLLVGCIVASACGYFDRSGIDSVSVYNPWPHGGLSMPLYSSVLGVLWLIITRPPSLLSSG